MKFMCCGCVVDVLWMCWVNRLFTIVLLENVPQLIIQLIYSIIIEITDITIFATLFSLISIILSLMDYFLQTKLLSIESIVIMKFKTVSNDIALFNRYQFKQIENKRRVFERELSKLLNIESVFVELLKPVHTNYGLDLTFHVRSDVLGDKIDQFQQRFAKDFKSV